MDSPIARPNPHETRRLADDPPPPRRKKHGSLARRPLAPKPHGEAVPAPGPLPWNTLPMWSGAELCQACRLCRPVGAHWHGNVYADTSDTSHRIASRWMSQASHDRRVTVLPVCHAAHAYRRIWASRGRITEPPQDANLLSRACGHTAGLGMRTRDRRLQVQDANCQHIKPQMPHAVSCASRNASPDPWQEVAEKGGNEKERGDGAPEPPKADQRNDGNRGGNG